MKTVPAGTPAVGSFLVYNLLLLMSATSRRLMARLREQSGIGTPEDASADEALALANAVSVKAREFLLGDHAESAETLLRDGLTNGMPLTDTPRACLLCNLAICAMHSGRPADAIVPLRHALALLPPVPASATAGAWLVASEPWVAPVRAQLHLNLCEALMLERHTAEARTSAREAVRLSQLALQASQPAPSLLTLVTPASGKPQAGLRPFSQPTPSTRRLLTARWLLPPTSMPADNIGAAGAAEPVACDRGPAGVMPAGAALVVSWVWLAVCAEALGLPDDALRSYRRAIEVAAAHEGSAAAQTLIEPLRKKVRVVLMRDACECWRRVPPCLNGGGGCAIGHGCTHVLAHGAWHMSPCRWRSHCAPSGRRLCRWGGVPAQPIGLSVRRPAYVPPSPAAALMTTTAPVAPEMTMAVGASRSRRTSQGCLRRREV